MDRRDLIELGFNPLEKRGPHGRWIKGGEREVLTPGQIKGAGFKKMLPPTPPGQIKTRGKASRILDRHIDEQIAIYREKGLNTAQIHSVLANRARQNDPLGNRLRQLGWGAPPPLTSKEVAAKEAGRYIAGLKRQGYSDPTIRGKLHERAGVIDTLGGQLRQIGIAPAPAVPAHPSFKMGKGGFQGWQAGPSIPSAGGFNPPPKQGQTWKFRVASAEGGKFGQMELGPGVAKRGDVAHGPGGTKGYVAGRAGMVIAVDAEDDFRHFIDRKDGHELNATPKEQVGPELPWMHGAPGVNTAPKPREPSPAGDYVAPNTKQLRLPGMPEREIGPNTPEVKRLAQIAASGELAHGHIREPHQGQQGTVQIVTLRDKSKVIKKVQYSQKRNDAEELSSYVSRAIGAGAPAIARDPRSPDDTLIEDYVPGTMGSDYLAKVYRDARHEAITNGAAMGDARYEAEQAVSEAEQSIYESPEGRQIGLLDLLTSNSDRNDGNWMVTPDGKPHPIDMGYAQYDGQTYTNDDEGMNDFISGSGVGDMADPYGEPMDEQEWNELYGKLSALQPEFTRLGRSGWYGNMMSQLATLNTAEAAKRGLQPYNYASIVAQALDLGWRFDPTEKRDVRGRWTRSGEGYIAPDHDRLVQAKRAGPYYYRTPADHPFFKKHPASAANVVAAYDDSNEQERAQGMRWYADAHNLAMKMDHGDIEKNAGVIAALSPQTGWAVNMLNADRSLDLGRALGPGEGMITGSMQANAQKAIDGMPADKANSSSKTKAFARLIRAGGDEPGDRLGQVVIDRHAMTVALGERLPKKESDAAPIDKDRFYQYVADTYRDAALEISKRGTPISPHQLQAITWLRQQRINEAEDEAHEMGTAVTEKRGGKRLAKGRATALKNAWAKWTAEAAKHQYPTVPGTTGLLTETYANTLIGQFLDMGFNPAELRGPHGRWAKAAGEMSGVSGEAGHRTPDTRPELSGAELWSSGEGRCPDISPAETAAVARIWYSGNALHTNIEVREHNGPATPDEQAFKNLIDRSPPLSRPAVMYHGTYLGWKLFGQPGEGKGKKFSDKGFVSLTASQDTAQHYGDTLIRVHVPAGAHALRADQGIWDATGANADYPLGGVQEFTLAPGSHYEVTDDHMEGTLFGRARIIDANLVPGDAETTALAFALDGGEPDPQGLPGHERFTWGEGDIEFEEDEQEHAGSDGQVVELRFDPAQLRDTRGRWTRFGGVGEAADTMMKNREGFSVSVRSGKEPAHGYMIAQVDHTHTYPESILDDHAALTRAIDDMLTKEKAAFASGDTYLGGWVHDGKLWLEPSDNIADREQAVHEGTRRNQIAIWDVDNGAEIDTGGSGGGRITEHANTQGGGWPDPSGLRGPGRGDPPGLRRGAGDGDTAGTITGQLDLGFNPLEHRGPHGRWAKEGESWSLDKGQLDAAKRAYKNDRLGRRTGLTPTPAPDTVPDTQLWGRINAEADAAEQAGLDDVARELRSAGRMMEFADFKTAWRSSAAGYLSNAAQLARKHGQDNRARHYDELAHAVRMMPESAVQKGTAQAAAVSEVKKDSSVVGKLLGAPETQWNGKVNLFTQGSREKGLLAELDWNGDINMREDVALGIRDARDHPDQPVQNPVAFEVVEHELFHGVTPKSSKLADMQAYQDYATAQIEEGFTELGAIQHGPEFMDQIGIGDRKTATGGGLTMHELAAEAAQPNNIARGNSWGHYPQATKDAQDWVRMVAMQENRMIGAPQTTARIAELTDEINRQGAAGKIPAMAHQLARAITTSDKMRSDQPFMGGLEKTIAADIRKEWNTDDPAGAAIHAYSKASAAAWQKVAAKEHEMAEVAA